MVSAVFKIIPTTANIFVIIIECGILVLIVFLGSWVLSVVLDGLFLILTKCVKGVTVQA